tara:strand:- start:1393 stop:1728 length:336 start_codon:yes stop_codon:yes gene_type:complete
MKLYKSDKKEHLFLMRIETENVYFGDPSCLNYCMANDKRRSTYLYIREEREKLKDDFVECVDVRELSNFKSPICLEYFILYNKMNIKKSVDDYCMKFGVCVRNHHRKVYGS